MVGLENESLEQLSALADCVNRLKHDLGKYIWFRQAWLGEDADLESRRTALEADVRQTRRGPAGTLDAQEVWGEFRAVLLGEVDFHGRRFRIGDARLDTIVESMAALEHLGNFESEQEVERASLLCKRVSEAIRDLARDLRLQVRDASASAQG